MHRSKSNAGKFSDQILTPWTGLLFLTGVGIVITSERQRRKAERARLSCQVAKATLTEVAVIEGQPSLATGKK